MQASPFTLPFAAIRRQPRGTEAVAARPPSADASIRARLLAALASQRSWDPDTSNVFVDDGVAILQGLFRRQADRRAACEAARRVPGVRAVRDDRTRAREWQTMA